MELERHLGFENKDITYFEKEASLSFSFGHWHSRSLLGLENLIPQPHDRLHSRRCDQRSMNVGLLSRGANPSNESQFEITQARRFAARNWPWLIGS